VAPAAMQMSAETFPSVDGWIRTPPELLPSILSGFEAFVLSESVFERRAVTMSSPLQPFLENLISTSEQDSMRWSPSV